MADAVVVPGGMFGPAAGMLMYAAAVAERRGATIHRHAWSAPPGDPFDPGVEGWVTAQIIPVLDAVEGRPLVIGKSLGSNAAGIAAARGLPAVWLTPVLTVEWVVSALGRATAPFLLVGGTADAVWDGAVARRLTPHVLEVPGANHGMSVPGPLTDSIAVLGRMVTAIGTFLDEIGWPTGTNGPNQTGRPSGTGRRPSGTDPSGIVPSMPGQPGPIGRPGGIEPSGTGRPSAIGPSGTGTSGTGQPSRTGQGSGTGQASGTGQGSGTGQASGTGQESGTGQGSGRRRPSGIGWPD